MIKKIFGSAPDRWTLGLWCEERPWTWSAGLQPTTIRIGCPDDRQIFKLPIAEYGLWPSRECPACNHPLVEHIVLNVTIGVIRASPLCLLEETLFISSFFDGPDGRWRALYRRWFPNGRALNPASVAQKCAVAIAATLTHQARATTARPVIQRMLALPRAELKRDMIRRLIRPLGLVTERMERIIMTMNDYDMFHTPSDEPCPRKADDDIGPHAVATVRAIVLGQAIETDDPYLSRYVEWLKIREET